MNIFERGLHSVDRAQQARRTPGFVVGVVKKFGDDRGGQLSALITYYAFAAVFPLLLLLTTGLGFVLHGNPGAQRAVLHSALADFPIIGNQLQDNVHSLQGTGAAVAIGTLGLLYGSLGMTQILQFAMAQVWNIPGTERPGFFDRIGRGLLMLLALGLGLALSTATAGLVGFLAHGALAWVGGLIGSVAVNIGLYLACFRILTPEEVTLRQLLPGCLIAGPFWTALQTFGGILVAHQLRHSTQVYGFFGTVLGLISWLYLAARITMYAAEVNVVRARRLWPRSLTQPPLTRADREVLDALVRQEERRPEQQVLISFKDQPEQAPAPSKSPQKGVEGHT
ncbi:MULTISPECIES: YihY/virulence factor BrkB family protein [Streptacidiphilus]|uniref:YihY/virulence factor BrkB family protein n=1 Tax=Streptacidiphilus cavernicola TaxID=3342716 RepID=A0ABV6UET7_9ACTN|nr:YihY/virulence factor BrkB family protein [Streptacidiphilus jeojiense]